MVIPSMKSPVAALRLAPDAYSFLDVAALHPFPPPLFLALGRRHGVCGGAPPFSAPCPRFFLTQAGRAPP